MTHLPMINTGDTYTPTNDKMSHTCTAMIKTGKYDIPTHDKHR